jgi:cbb3-type cytochrome oxidase maturation protein
MDQATLGLTLVTGVVGLVFLGFLIWGIRSGQFHNVEEAKYQVFRDEEKSGGENGANMEVEEHEQP